MKTSTKNLLQDLVERTRKNINEAEGFDQLAIKTLNWKEHPESWSVLECLEHLNRYGDFYLPEIERQIASSKHATSETFKSGWLGNYFAKSMLPKEKLNTMKTFKSMNPVGSDLDKAVVHRFIEQQHKLLDLLDQSKNVNLTKTKTGISISKFIRLRLGDTFRVVIYHNQRHMAQAAKAVSKASS